MTQLCHTDSILPKARGATAWMRSFIAACPRVRWSNLGLVILLLWNHGAWAGWHDAVPDARLLGRGEFTFLGFRVYAAELWGDQRRLDYSHPFALHVTYARKVSGVRLTDTGMSEIERLTQHPIAPDVKQRWRADMTRAFPDVGPGDQLTGVFVPGMGVRFFVNETPSVDIADMDFAKAFFGIWLDPRTRDKTLRANLLGGNAATVASPAS